MAFGLFALVTGCGRVGFDSLGPTPLAEEESISSPPFALTPRTDARGYVAVFAHIPPGESEYRLVLVRTDAAGMPLDIPRRIAALDESLELAFVTPTAEGYRVFFLESGEADLQSVLVDPTGEPLGEVASFGDRRRAKVAAIEEGYLVAYRTQNDSGVWEVRVQRYDLTLEPIGDPHIPLPATDAQNNVSIGASGDGYAVSFLDSAPSPDVVQLALLDLDGSLRAPVEELGEGWGRTILADGEGGFVIGYELDGETLLTRRDMNGAALWDEPYVLPRNLRESQDLTFAVDDATVEVAWQSDDLSGLAVIDNLGLNLADGSLLRDRSLISHPGVHSASPTAAAGTEDFAVIYSTQLYNRRGAFVRMLR